MWVDFGLEDVLHLEVNALVMAMHVARFIWPVFVVSILIRVEICLSVVMDCIVFWLSMLVLLKSFCAVSLDWWRSCGELPWIVAGCYFDDGGVCVCCSCQRATSCLHWFWRIRMVAMWSCRSSSAGHLFSTSTRPMRRQAALNRCC